MGINGLLKTLEFAQKPVTLEHYRGQTAAVDGYVWLHKGIYAAASDLAQGKPTDKHITYCMRKIAQLQHYGITVVVVLDGAALIAKSGEEDDRRKKREQAAKRASDLHREGDISKAHSIWAQSVEVTLEMAQLFINELRRAGVSFVVAPYEADAQLAFLSKSGKVDLCISEDSDLLAFGCNRVLFKLDKFGSGIEISQEAIFRIDCMRGIDREGFLLMCILSGCDYLPSLPGIGPKKALGFVRASTSPTIEAVLRIARLDGFHVPREYYASVENARLTFLHQTVYDSDKGCVCPLNPLTDGISHRSCFGPLYDDKTAVYLAQGGVPEKHETKENFEVMSSPISAKKDDDGWIAKKPRLIVKELGAYLSEKKPAIVSDKLKALSAFSYSSI